VRRELSRADQRRLTILGLVRERCQYPLEVTGSNVEEVLDGGPPSLRFITRIRELATQVPADEPASIAQDRAYPANLLDIERLEPWLERMLAATIRQRTAAIHALRELIGPGDPDASQGIMQALSAFVRKQAPNNEQQTPRACLLNR
jgi:hypothetical protein